MEYQFFITFVYVLEQIKLSCLFLNTIKELLTYTYNYNKIDLYLSYVLGEN